MPLPSHTGYIMLAKQTAQGTVATPSVPVAFLDDAHSINMDIQTQKNGEDILIDSLKMKHSEVFGWSCYARPNLAAYLFAYVLGADSVAGGADPYTHTITYADQGRDWLTVERKLSTVQMQRLYDCKIGKLSISGESGFPLKFGVEGEALKVILRTTTLTPTYETRDPFMFYDGTGRFSYAGATISTIKSFQIDITVDSLGGLQNAEYENIDLPDFAFDIACQLNFNQDDFTNWKNIAYGGGTTRTDSVYAAALDFDFRYTENVADDRQLKITIPSIQYQSVGGNTLTAAGGTMLETVAGVARKLATTEMITVTVKNSISTDLT